MIREGSGPLVSVLMTSYNREDFIADAIESVLLSEYENFELIISDDRSSDRTVEIARSFSEKDKRVKVFINVQNLGDYPNRNKSAGYASGKYLMFCDSDDMFFPDSIKYCVSAMEENQAAAAGYYNAAAGASSHLVNGKELLHRHFFDKPVLNIGPGGIIIRRDFFFSINCFPVKYGPANDMYFNIKVAASADVVLLPKLFLYYRIHPGQEKNNEYSYLYNNYLFLNDVLNEVDTGLSPAEKAYLSAKNNRRFSVNIFRYFLKTYNFHAVKKAWLYAGFSFSKLINGIFH